MHSKSKIIIDVLMIVGMAFSMSLHFFGVGTHKLIGLLTFVLFIAHNILNRGWYKGLFKGKYTPARMIHAITNIIVVMAVVGIMISGVMLSKDMANGLADTMTLGRILHIASSYIASIGIALHIGFHLKRKKDDDR